MQVEAPYFIEFPFLRQMENEAISKNLLYVEYKLPDDSYYQGYVQNTSKCGPGVIKWKDGTKYEGEWKDEMRHGKGQLWYPNGHFYEG